MNCASSCDNKLEFTDFIINNENIPIGAGFTKFDRLNLTKAQFQALGLNDNLENFYIVDKHNLDQRDKIINVISVSTNDMPVNSEIIINYYNKLFGLIGTLTKTLPAVTAGSKYIHSIFDSELEDVDYFTIRYRFIQDDGVAYEVSVDLRVKKKIDETGSGSAFQDHTEYASAGQTIFITGFNSNRVVVNNSYIMPDQYTGQGTDTITFLVGLNLNDLVYITT